MPRAWIALGSNLGDPPAQLRTALAQLRGRGDVEVERCSRFYRSAPLGPSGQNHYCNAACAVTTELAPRELLGALQEIEHRMGRDRRGPRWGARLIDLDLLLYGEVVMTTPDLVLPHPELHRRNFVLAPLAELAPDLVIPGLGAVTTLLGSLGQDGLGSWPSEDDSHTESIHLV